MSRLAAAKGVSTADLCYDMRGAFRRLLSFEDEPLAAVAEFGGLSPEQMEELVSWTGKPVGDVRSVLRGEAFVSRAVRNPTMRGCPICLREDMENSGKPPLQSMVMRGHWLLRDTCVCVEHCHPLVPLWTEPHFSRRNDIGLQLEGIVEDIRRGAFERPRIEVSDYDLWLDQRLESGKDTTWFADQPLSASVIMCYNFGFELLRLNQAGIADSADTNRAARAAGFAVLSRGEPEIRTAIRELAAAGEDGYEEPSGAFGKIYSVLTYEHVNDPGLDRIRRIFREVILDTWPIEPGTDLLGEHVATRKLHSVTTAAREAGTEPELMRKLLIDAEVIDANGALPDRRTTFSAEVANPILARISDVVSLRTMRDVLGATRTELEALVAENILIPLASSPEIRKRWRREDGVKLMEEITRGATPVAADDPAWVDLLHVRMRSGISLRGLIKLIGAGHFRVGLREGKPWFRNVVLQKTEIDLLGRAQDDQPIGEMSASEFGRAVGLRYNGDFIALIEAGHTPATRSRHPVTRQDQWRMTNEDIAAFHRRFVTIATLRQETGRSSNALRMQLKKEKIERFAPDGGDFGSLWLRTAAMQIL